MCIRDSRCIEAVMPDGSIMNFSSNVVKNTTGYDVKDLIIGSEGTLCILTEVTLKLLPAPTCTCTLVMPFKSLEECADMVPKVLELPFVPTAIEFLERELIDIVERNLNKMFPVKEGEAVPVSYTHLDVYKRQINYKCDIKKVIFIKR